MRESLKDIFEYILCGLMLVGMLAADWHSQESKIYLYCAGCFTLMLALRHLETGNYYLGIGYASLTDNTKTTYWITFACNVLFAVGLFLLAYFYAPEYRGGRDSILERIFVKLFQSQ